MSRVIVHLSDIHFGRVDSTTVKPLHAAVRQIGPHVVVVSGDLTQRAKVHEFEQARAFLAELPKPQIVVPGNHDVPLYNLYGRFVERLDKYREYISEDLEPSYVDDEIAVLGINTARSLTWKGGRVSADQVGRMHTWFCSHTGGQIRILVTHHPFDLPGGYDDRHLVGRARHAMQRLAECGTDILLAGHLHVHHTNHTAERYQIAGHSAIIVQAGTATSTRGRGEPNSFNRLEISKDGVTVERWLWNPINATFAVDRVERFRKGPAGWIIAA